MVLPAFKLTTRGPEGICASSGPPGMATTRSTARPRPENAAASCSITRSAPPSSSVGRNRASRSFELTGVISLLPGNYQSRRPRRHLTDPMPPATYGSRDEMWPVWNPESRGGVLLPRLWIASGDRRPAPRSGAGIERGQAACRGGADGGGADRRRGSDPRARPGGGFDRHGRPAGGAERLLPGLPPPRRVRRDQLSPARRSDRHRTHRRGSAVRGSLPVTAARADRVRPGG